MVALCNYIAILTAGACARQTFSASRGTVETIDRRSNTSSPSGIDDDDNNIIITSLWSFRTIGKRRIGCDERTQ